MERERTLDDVSFRPATDADAAQVAAVYLASRQALLAFAPLVHTEEAMRQWVARWLIPSGGVTVAVSGNGEGAIVGMMAVSRHADSGWLDQLYLLPGVVGHGLGTRLLTHAKAILDAPIRLYTFQANVRACRFYERHGFRAIAWSDGSDNEEGCPDVLYEWTETT